LDAVHKDMRVQFAGNRYCAPPRLVGERLTIKADNDTVTLFHRQRMVASYARCWRRGQTFGAERFEKELLAQKAAAARSQSQQRLIALLAVHCPHQAIEDYLRGIADNGRSLSRQITELLDLIRLYGSEDVARCLNKALDARAFGTDYVANLLRQHLSPRHVQPPLRLKNPDLNQLATDPLSLAAYDAFFLPPKGRFAMTPQTMTTPPNPLALKLEQLRLTTIRQRIEQTINDAADANLSFASTLERLVDLELEARRQRSVERQVKQSKLQSPQSIAAFQFAYHKSRQQAKARILKLLDLDFVRRGANVVLVGNPGTGKTMLAKILAFEACQNNFRVLFTRAMDMLKSPSMQPFGLSHPAKGILQTTTWI
jgi:SpoVK/Ycf46/Vps4 family AAA+-type ATPase